MIPSHSRFTLRARPTVSSQQTNKFRPAHRQTSCACHSAPRTSSISKPISSKHWLRPNQSQIQFCTIRHSLGWRIFLGFYQNRHELFSTAFPSLVALRVSSIASIMNSLSEPPPRTSVPVWPRRAHDNRDHDIPRESRRAVPLGRSDKPPRFEQNSRA